MEEKEENFWSPLRDLGCCFSCVTWESHVNLLGPVIMLHPLTPKNHLTHGQKPSWPSKQADILGTQQHISGAHCLVAREEYMLLASNGF